MEAFDGKCEQPLRDSGVDRAARLALSQEATSLDLSAWSLLGDNAQPQQNQLSDANLQGIQPDALSGNLITQPQSQLLDLSLQGMQQDSGGRLVQLDVLTGKLLTRDDQGRTVDYEASRDSERMSGKNAVGMASLFVGSPLMLFGLGAAFTIIDDAQDNSQQKEVERLRRTLDGRPPEQQQQNPQRSRGYLDDIMRAAILDSKTRKLSEHQDLSGLLGLHPERFPNQRIFDLSEKRREKARQKRKGALDKKATVERKRQKRRASMSVERNNITSTKLIKRRRKIENQIEHSRGKASLAEVSRLHSELEVMDRAITNLTALGL